jgi:hypothetical protein
MLVKGWVENGSAARRLAGAIHFCETCGEAGGGSSAGNGRASCLGPRRAIGLGQRLLSARSGRWMLNEGTHVMIPTWIFRESLDLPLRGR